MHMYADNKFVKSMKYTICNLNWKSAKDIHFILIKLLTLYDLRFWTLINIYNSPNIGLGKFVKHTLHVHLIYIS